MNHFERPLLTLVWGNEKPTKLTILQNWEGVLCHQITVSSCMSQESLGGLLADLFSDHVPKARLKQTPEKRWATLCELQKYNLDPIITQKACWI